MKFSQSESTTEIQSELNRPLLSSLLDKGNNKDKYIVLGDLIDWDSLRDKLGERFHESEACPGIPMRLMVGLTYLKSLHKLSDEKLLEWFVQNPYWQYFCGFSHFQTEKPCEAESLVRFREWLGVEGAKELLKQTEDAVHRAGL